MEKIQYTSNRVFDGVRPVSPERKVALIGARDLAASKRKSIANIIVPSPRNKSMVNKFMEEISGMEEIQYTVTEERLYREVKYNLGEPSDGGYASWSTNTPNFFFMGETLDETDQKAIMAIDAWHKYRDSL